MMLMLCTPPISQVGWVDDVIDFLLFRADCCYCVDLSVFNLEYKIKFKNDANLPVRVPIDIIPLSCTRSSISRKIKIPLLSDSVKILVIIPSSQQQQMPINTIVRLTSSTASTCRWGLTSWRTSRAPGIIVRHVASSCNSRVSVKDIFLTSRFRSFRAVASIADDTTGKQQENVWLWQGLSMAVLATTGWMIQQQTPSYVAMEALPKGIVMSDAVCNNISVSVWERKGRTIYLVGSDASYKSTTLAGEVVKDVRPQAVFVELDMKSVLLGLAGGIRFATSTSNDPELPIVKSENGPLPIIGLPLHKVLIPTPEVDTSKQKPITTLTFHQPQIQPGFDLAHWNYLNERLHQYSYVMKTESAHPRSVAFFHALKEGLNVGATIVLGDGNAERTRQEVDAAWRATDWSMTLAEWIALRKMLRSEHDGSDEALESAIKQVKLLKRQAPLVYQALLEERDEYMAAGMDSLKQFKSIVAVTGAVHVVGVAKHLLERGWKPVAKYCPLPNRETKDGKANK